MLHVTASLPYNPSTNEHNTSSLALPLAWISLFLLGDDTKNKTDSSGVISSLISSEGLN